MHNVEIHIYPDKIQKLPAFLGIWFSRNSHVAFFPTSKKTRASRHLKRLDYWWVSSNHPPDCWALRTSQAGEICLVSSTRRVLPSLKPRVPSLNTGGNPKGKPIVFQPSISSSYLILVSGRVFLPSVWKVPFDGDEWGSMDQQTNNSHNGGPSNLQKPLKPKIRPNILWIGVIDYITNIIWPQPKQGTIFSGKPRKMTVPVHQLWSPENGSRLMNPEGVKLMTNRNILRKK